MAMLRRGVSLALATALVVPGVMLTAVPAAHAKQTVVNGEVLRKDTTWTRAGSPYVIRRAIQIPHGVTLTVEPGVSVIGQGTDHLFVVGGNLAITGSPSTPVSIEAGRRGSIIRHATTHTRTGSVNISYARITNTRSIMPAGGNGMYIQFILADSIITRVPGVSHVWYPLPGSAIVRNTFSASGGLSIGMDARPADDGTAESPIRVEGNRFLTRSTSRFWIENWAAYGAPLPVHGNSFLAAGAPALFLPGGYSNSAIDGRGNFWGTTQDAVIDRMIFDAQDDITRASIIEYKPVLTSAPKGPPATTPTAPPDISATSMSVDSAQVTWAAPIDTGGRGRVTYSVTASPGPGGCTVTGVLSCRIEGLPSGTHTFTVTARNSAGISAPSSASAPLVMGGGTPEPPPSGVLASVSLGAISMETRGRWVAPDGCGNYLFAFSGVQPNDIGTFSLVDAATGKKLDSDITFGRLSTGVGSFTVCAFETNAQMALALELDFSGYGTVRSSAFAWETKPAPLPSPGSLPASVSLGSISVGTTGAWPRPVSGCVNYLFAHTGITTEDIGSIRLIDAVRRTVLDSEVYLGRPGNGVGSFTVCSYQVTTNNQVTLQLDFAGLGVVESRNFDWQRTPVTSPSIRPLPAVASIGNSAVSTSGNWSVPTSCRNFSYVFSGMPTDAVASVRVVNAVSRAVLGSDVLLDPPANGTGEIFLCSFNVSSSTVARLQVDIAGVGLVESEAFRFGS